MKQTSPHGNFFIQSNKQNFKMCIDFIFTDFEVESWEISFLTVLLIRFEEVVRRRARNGPVLTL